MADDDKRLRLDVFTAQVDAACRLSAAQAAYNRAAVEILGQQLANAASALRVRQLSQAIHDFELAYHQALRAARLAERRRDLIADIVQSASWVLMGHVPADTLTMAWRSFWQLVRLASIGCQQQIGSLEFGGVNACEHFRATRMIPEIGSPAWLVLAEIVKLLEADAAARSAETEKQAAAAEAQLAELRQQRADQIATVGIKPLTTGG
jgi:hypothetical protein